MASLECTGLHPTLNDPSLALVPRQNSALSDRNGCSF